MGRMLLAIGALVVASSAGLAGPGAVDLHAVPSAAVRAVSTVARARSGAARHPATTSPPAAPVQHYPGGSWNRLAYAPDGRSVAAFGLGPVTVWSPVTGPLVQTVATDGVPGLAWSPNGRTLALGGADARIRLVAVATGRSVRTLVGHTGDVGALAWSPDGRHLASASADATVRLWDAGNGKLVRTLTQPAPVTSVVYSPDGRQLATSTSDGTVRTWNALTGAGGATLIQKAGSGITLAFTPDGRQLVAGLDGSIAWWDAATGSRLPGIDGLGPVAGLAFSPEGRTLVFTQSDDVVSVWDTRSRRVVRTFDGRSRVTAEGVAYAPDGSGFATFSGMTGPVRFWTP